MAASMPVITPATLTARQVLQLPTPEVVAGRPKMGAATKPVIILIKLVVRQAVPIPQALVPAALTRFPMVAGGLAKGVLLAVTRPLPTGAPSILHVMATAAKTALLILVIRNAAVTAALPVIQATI